MIHERVVVTLACDFCRNAEATFEGNEGATRAWAKAREAGWQSYPAQRKAKCPSCVAAARKAPVAKT